MAAIEIQKMRTKEKRNSQWGIVLYVVAFLAIFGLVFRISPISDDWHYLTSPNPGFNLSDLLPGKVFWRPFDALFGGLIGLVPRMFPYLNRFVVVLAHIFNAVLLKRILDKAGISQKWCYFSSCFFMFSSATWAVTVSPDALNQAYSLLFGLLAIWVHMNKGGYYYLLFSALSLFWKESGISWLFVVPLWDIASSQIGIRAFCRNAQQVKKAAKQVLASTLVVCGYFALRFALQGDVQLGSDTGNYRINLVSLNFVKNIVLLVASAGTGIDSIALFGAHKSIALLCLTTGLSLVFLAAWCIAIMLVLRKKKPIFPLVCIGICILGLAAPLSVLGHAGEMHAYPVLFGMAVLFGYGFDLAELPLRKVLIGVVAIALAFAISSAHKLAAIYDYSAQTKRVEQEIAQQYETKTGKVLFVVIDEKEGYSVFTQQGIVGTGYGESMRKYLCWEKLDHTSHNVQTEEEAKKYLQENQNKYTQIFLVKNDRAEKVK